jgi:hypothetical protein
MAGNYRPDRPPKIGDGVLTGRFGRLQSSAFDVSKDDVPQFDSDIRTADRENEAGNYVFDASVPIQSSAQHSLLVLTKRKALRQSGNRARRFMAGDSAPTLPSRVRHHHVLCARESLPRRQIVLPLCMQGSPSPLDPCCDFLVQITPRRRRTSRLLFPGSSRSVRRYHDCRPWLVSQPLRCQQWFPNEQPRLAGACRRKHRS